MWGSGSAGPAHPGHLLPRTFQQAALPEAGAPGSLPVPSTCLFYDPNFSFPGESVLAPASFIAQVPLTFLGPGALVVDSLPLLQDLDGGIAAHIKPAGQCRLRGGVYFSDRNGRVVLLQGTGNFFIFWSKLLTMAAPTN